ncbi:hypothetical protein BS17DRAFT_189419 [Gyrodon lividus]|nr:hypothetical protein BS17DRAFT_189419 [Gyrodon lividus]
MLPRSSDITILLGPFIAFGVQSFFTYRLYRLSNSLPLPIFCSALAVARVVLVFVVGAAGFSTPDVLSYEHKWGPSITALLVVSAVCDLTITAGLCYNLANQKKSAHTHTSFLLNRIIIWTVETGLATGLTEIVEVICFLTMPHNYIWMGFYSMSTGIYLNSLLIALNRRKKIRTGAPEVHEFSSVEHSSGAFFLCNAD